ncbi:hypothetical protein [Candidatus Tisiphia endosymbiont of Neophilaenus lineatus]
MLLIIYKLFPTFAQYLIYISLNLTVPVDLVKSIMYRDWINTPC